MDRTPRGLDQGERNIITNQTEFIDMEALTRLLKFSVLAQAAGNGSNCLLSYFFLINLFIFGCVGSSLLCVGFL